MQRELKLSVGAALVAIAMLYAGSGHAYSDAYVFPNLVAWVMLGLAVLRTVCLIAHLSGAAERSRVEKLHLRRLIPVLVVLPLYVLVAETLGFLISALLAFFAISRVYALTRPGERITPRYLAISASFVGALFLIFVVLLQVPMPDGLVI
jgi:hypothetical protein